jgi:hypothetical protein
MAISGDVAERFKIKESKSVAIVAGTTGLPFGGTSGWSNSLR